MRWQDRLPVQLGRGRARFCKSNLGWEGKNETEERGRWAARPQEF